MNKFPMETPKDHIYYEAIGSENPLDIKGKIREYNSVEQLFITTVTQQHVSGKLEIRPVLTVLNRQEDDPDWLGIPEDNASFIDLADLFHWLKKNQNSSEVIKALGSSLIEFESLFNNV